MDGTLRLYKFHKYFGNQNDKRENICSMLFQLTDKMLLQMHSDPRKVT